MLRTTTTTTITTSSITRTLRSSLALTHRSVTRRQFSSSSSTSSTSTSKSAGKKKFATEEERQAYLREANRQMQDYHHTRELYKQGKLPSQQQLQKKNNYDARGRQHGIQLAIVGLFVVSFFSMPFLGKRIATDDDFRRKWIPSWYDFTMPKPERPWTRDELHEQMLQVQKDIRERAIKGDFSPEKLKEMQSNLQGDVNNNNYNYNNNYPHRANLDAKNIPKGWDSIHPGMDDDEKLHED